MPLLRRPPPPVASVLARLGGLRARQGWTPHDPLAAAGPPDPVAGATFPGPAAAGPAELGAGSGVRAPSTAWRTGRLDPGRRGAGALVALAVLVALLAAVVVLRARPHEVAVPAQVVVTGRPVPGSTPSSTGDAAGSAGPAGPAGTLLVVAVDGKVVHPGLVRLPAGSRVDDGIRAAGGALPGTDLAGLNLARKLVDGEQVVVGAPPPPAAAAGGAAGGLVDLNTATVADLDALPGIGPVLAQHIVDWRTEHGSFGSVDQLREVSGIGESKYTQLKAKVRV